MISSLQAYNYAAMDSVKIVDKLNIVGNNFAISSDGAAEALKRSASTLVESGNSLEQSLAMVAAANKVIQDPEQVGAALKVLSLRLRGTKTELEAMGESTEGMATTTSKLRDQVLALTNIDGSGGVDILTASGEYRDTYDVLVDIAEVYDDILAKDNKDAAALTELLAGKHRANVLSSLLQNPEDLKDAYEMALDSEGSAMAENEKYLDSIQGKIDVFTNSLQTMWMNALDSDAVKFVIDLGNAVIKLIDTLGMLPTALGAFAGFSVAKDLIKADFKEIENGGKSVSNIFNRLSNVLNGTANAAQANANATNQDTAAKQANAQATNEDTAAEKANTQAVNEDTTAEKTNTQTVNQDTTSEKINTQVVNQDTAAERINTVATNQSTTADMAEAAASNAAAAADAAEAASGGTGVLSKLLGGKTAGSLGKFVSKLGVFAKGGIKGLAIGAAITLATAGISKLVGKIGELHVSQEEAAQSAQETLNAYTSTTEELKTTKSTINDLSSEFETLSSGVDRHGNNINLSTEEYKRYNEIANQIADLFPQMVTGYTAEGNAILSCKGNVEALTDAYKEQEQAARQSLIQDSSNIFDTFKNDYADDLAKQQDTVEKMIELYNSGDYDGIASLLRSSGNLSDMWNGIGVDSSTVFSRLTGLNEEEFDKIVPQLHSYLQSLQTQINAQAANVTPLIAAYIGEDVNYQALETEQQNLINTLVSNLDAEFLNQYDSAEDVYAWIRKNFIDPLSDPAISAEFSSVIDGMFDTQAKFDQGKMSLGEYQEHIGEFIDYINNMDIDKDAKIQLADMFDLSLDDTTQLDAQVEAMIGRTKKILKEDDWGKISSLDFSDLQMIDALEVEDGVTYSWEELRQKIQDVQNELGTTVDAASTFSALSTEVESYNSLVSQTSEVVANNTEITQEYKDALVTLVGDQDKVNECFYEGNPLVVKNAQALQELVESAKDTTAANIELAESQSRLQYRELVLELNNVCNSTEEFTEETISSTHALLDQIDKVQLAIQKYQLLRNNLELAGGAFDTFKQAQEIDALNTTGDTMVEMVQTMYDAFYSNGQVGTEAFNAAVQALVPDNVYAHLKTEGQQLEAIYKYLNNNLLPTLTNDGGTISIDAGDIDEFVGKMQQLNILTKDSSKSGELNIVENMELKEAARLMGMTEAQFSAMLMEVEKYDFNPNGTSLLSQFIGGWDDEYAETLSSLEELNRQKLALMEDGGYEKHKEEIDAINGQIKEVNNELGLLGDKAYESFDKFTKAETALTTLEKFTQEEREATKMTQELADALHLGDLEIDWDNKTLQQVYDELELIREKVGEPSTLQLDVALDEVESDLEQLEKDLKERGITISAHVKQDEDTGEYTVTSTSGLNQEEIALVEDYADLKNLQTLLPEYISNGMTATEQSLSNIETIVGAIADKLGAKVPKEEKKETTNPKIEKIADMTESSSKDKPVTTKDLVKEEEGKLAELKEEREKLIKQSQSRHATQADLDAVVDINNQIQAQEEQIKQTRLDGWTEALKAVDGASRKNKNREIVVEAVTKYAEGGTIEDLLADLQAIENEEIRANIIATLSKEGAFDDLLSTLHNADKQIVIKALTEGTGDVEKLNTIINNLPEDVQPTVRALVDEALTNVEIVDGQLELIDGKTANTTITGDASGAITAAGDADSAVKGVTPEWSTQFLGNPKDTMVTADQVQDAIENVDTSHNTTFTATIGSAFWDKINTAKNAILNVATQVNANLSGGKGASVNGTAHAKGTAWANGTAFKGGGWGAPRTERALVGELGPEMVVRGSRWFTVGDNGAEFTDIRKGDIIFNHQQTKNLLSNGYVTSRGKIQGVAHAQGTANAEGTAYALWTVSSDGSGGHKTTKSGSDKSSSKSTKEYSDDFEEIFDWFEIKIEEINEDLDLMGAKLENAITLSSKNNILDSMIATNKTQLTTLEKGIKLYTDYANNLLNKIPSAYRSAAQDGKIAIEEFAGAADEETLEAINNYREWAQKVAELEVNLEEVNKEIENLAKQKFDNVYESYDVKTAIEKLQNEKLQSAITYDEERGYITSEKYYKEMMRNTKEQAEYLKTARAEMQKTLDDQVKAGNVKKYSDAWYEMVQQMYEVDLAIDECTLELEEFQNAINDIYWDNFDELDERLSDISDEISNLTDLMGDIENPVITPETDDGWSADEVEWSKEGMAQLGLYAQQMEVAEHKAKKYAEAIDELNQQYADGRYSESEYLEKLNELKDGQYDAIDSYYEAQDAIKDLNEARIDEVKNGIEKQIKAYEELIDKKKEELDAEKDLYNFQKDVMSQQKDISDIERQLAALSGDNSASARAKRKQLEAELAEARKELEDTYYERSLEDKQTGLDKELESFQEEKDAEIEKWEKYLEDVKVIVADTLALVQANAFDIYDTLQEKAKEYDLTLTDHLLNPWKDGILAVDKYADNFGNAISSTTDELSKLENGWQSAIDVMDKAAEAEINTQNKENDAYSAAEKYVPPPPEPKPTTTTPSTNTTSSSGTIKVGGKINAGSAQIYDYAGDKSGERQYYRNDPIYTVLAEKNGYLKVRYHKLSKGVTGWFKKSDVKAYAKGSKKIDKDQLALVHELGDELILHAGQNGKLEYLSKGSGVVPADLTSNLMDWGELNPQDILDRNRPSVGVSPEVHATEINLNIQYGDMLKIENFKGDNPDEIAKIVAKQFEKHTKDLNNALRKYTR